MEQKKRSYLLNNTIVDLYKYYLYIITEYFRTFYTAVELHIIYLCYVPNYSYYFDNTIKIPTKIGTHPYVKTRHFSIVLNF